MIAVVVHCFSGWAGFHRRPMLEALARNLVGQAYLLVVEPPLDPVQSVARRSWRSAAKAIIHPLEQQHENLWLLRRLRSPWRPDERAWTTMIAAALGQLPARTATAAMVFRPEQVAHLGLAGEDRVVYECYDEYRLERGFRYDATVHDLERGLLARADLVLTTSRPLYDSRSAEHSNVQYTPNGVDTRLFAQAIDPSVSRPDDMPNTAGPTIGYVGNVRSWLDYGMLTNLVESMSEARFVFVGPVSDQDGSEALTRYANVRLVGSKPRGLLPSYLRHMDVTICPFQTNEFLQHAMPLKVLECLAAGKAVVVPPLRALDGLTDMLYLGTGAQETLAALRTALDEADDPALVARRMARAREYDWDLLTRSTARAILDVCGATPAGGPEVETELG